MCSSNYDSIIGFDSFLHYSMASRQVLLAFFNTICSADWILNDLFFCLGDIFFTLFGTIYKGRFSAFYGLSIIKENLIGEGNGTEEGGLKPGRLPVGRMPDGIDPKGRVGGIGFTKVGGKTPDPERTDGMLPGIKGGTAIPTGNGGAPPINGNPIGTPTPGNTGNRAFLELLYYLCCLWLLLMTLLPYFLGRTNVIVRATTLLLGIGTTAFLPTNLLIYYLLLFF